MQANKRLLKLCDMEQLVYPSAPTMSADGQTAVFVRTVACAATDTYNSRLYSVSTAGGDAITLFPNLDANMDMPAYSPCGAALAFLMEVRGEKQVFVWDQNPKSAPKQLTTMRHGVSRYSWSPTGEQMVIETKGWPNVADETLFCEMSDEERKQWLWEQEFMPKIAEELRYKTDETYGFVDGSRLRLGMVSLADGAVKMLTDGTTHADKVSISPDGKQIAYHNYIYTHSEAARFEIFVMSLETGEAKQVSKDSKYISPTPPAFTEDGKNIIYAVMDATFVVSSDRANGFILKPVRQNIDSGEMQIIYPKDEVCHGLCASETSKTEYGTKNPAFQVSGNTLYFMSPWQGSSHLYSMNLLGEPHINQITKGEETIGSFCLPQNNKLLFIKGTMDYPDELFCLDLQTGAETRLTFLNPWLDEVANIRPVPMDVPTSDGKSSIHGWVISPKGYVEGDTFPIVIYIHGGPVVSYTSGWWHEFQLLAAAGLGVVYCDPRGSTGYGEGFSSMSYAWKDEPMDDLFAFSKAASERFPELDINRLGITGGSYGSYLTVKLMGRYPERFKAAVAQRVFCNPATSYGTGDMGSITTENPKPASFKAFIQNRAKRSLLTKIDNMKVPLLVLHGTADYRCSAEQAEQLFIAMKDRNPEIPVRLVFFPGENHDITRGGKITHRMRHVGEMVDWLEKYLAKGGGVDVNN